MDNAFQTGCGSFWQMDGCHVIPAAWASSTSFNTPACDQTTQFINNLMYKYHVLVPGSELGSNGESPSGQDLNLFAAGKIAMYLEGDWNTDPAWKAIGTKFKIGVVPLPAGPDGRWSVFNGLIDGINVHTPHFQEAWELEQWLGSAASQKIMGWGVTSGQRSRRSTNTSPPPGRPRASRCRPSRRNPSVTSWTGPTRRA